MTSNPPLRHQNQQGSVSARRTEALMRRFEEDLRVRHAALTAGNYRGHVQSWLAWLGEETNLADVRTDDLLAYQSALYAMRKPDGRPYSGGFHVNRLKALKSFFRFLVRRRYVLSDPTASVEYPRGEQRLPRTILTAHEAARLIETARGRSPRELRDRALMETLYSTGVRVGELARLTLHDIDTEERVLRVVAGKGRKDRYVPLTRAAARTLERYVLKGRPALAAGRRAPFLFLTGAGGRMHSTAVYEALGKWTKKARLKKRVTPHTFRHTLATHLLRGGADIRHIQKLLGHSSLQSTERYTRVEIQDLKDVVRRAHPRNR